MDVEGAGSCFVHMVNVPLLSGDTSVLVGRSMARKAEGMLV